MPAKDQPPTRTGTSHLNHLFLSLLNDLCEQFILGFVSFVWAARPLWKETRVAAYLPFFVLRKQYFLWRSCGRLVNASLHALDVSGVRGKHGFSFNY